MFARHMWLDAPSHGGREYFAGGCVEHVAVGDRGRREGGEIATFDPLDIDPSWSSRALLQIE
jgi:hypothetical protein